MKHTIITFMSKTSGKCLSVDYTTQEFEIASYYERKILVDLSYCLTPTIELPTDKELNKLKNTLLSYNFKQI